MGVAQWSTSDLMYAELYSNGFPSLSWVNAQVQVPFLATAKYRLKACAYVQVMGTPQHQGTVIVSAMPYNNISSSFTSINSLLQCPHAFLSANESTPVCVEIPFYSNTKLQNTDLTRRNPHYQTSSDYAELRFTVLNPLATSGSTTVSISINIVFTEAEFYIPKNDSAAFVTQAETSSSWTQPITNLFDSVTSSLKTFTGDFIDNGRKILRKYTGLHNPNMASPHNRMIVSARNFPNNVDVPVFYEKLDTFVDHDRTTNDFTFYTAADEMLISNIISKPQYVDTLLLSTASETGTLLFARPITPMQQLFGQRYINIPIQTISCMSKYWKGGLRLHLQSVMTGFHNLKIMVVRDYSQDERALTGFPSPYDVVNLQTDTIEFSAGGQVQTIDMPYCSILNQTQCHLDNNSNGLCHGMYYIYLMQPLVSSANVPDTVGLNVYISAAEDFQFFGLSTSNLEMVAQAETLSTPSSQDDVLNIVNDRQEVDEDDFKPMVSVRDYIRRVVQGPTIAGGSFRSVGDSLVATISVADLLRRKSFIGRQAYPRVIRKFFLGVRGSFKLKFVVHGVQEATVKYYPPHMVFAKTLTNAFEYTEIVSTDPTSNADNLLSHAYPNSTDSPTRDKYPFPYLERGADFTPMYSQEIDVVEPPTKRIYSYGKVALECAVPLASVLDFVGSGNESDNSTDRTYARDYGNIVITAFKYKNAPADDTLAPFIVPYIGYGDDTRLGFNVFSPPVRSPGTLFEDGFLSNGPYFYRDGTSISLDRPAASFAYFGGYQATTP